MDLKEFCLILEKTKFFSDFLVFTSLIQARFLLERKTCANSELAKQGVTPGSNGEKCLIQKKNSRPLHLFQNF